MPEPREQIDRKRRCQLVAAAGDISLWVGPAVFVLAGLHWQSKLVLGGAIASALVRTFVRVRLGLVSGGCLEMRRPLTLRCWRVAPGRRLRWLASVPWTGCCWLSCFYNGTVVLIAMREDHARLPVEATASPASSPCLHVTDEGHRASLAGRAQVLNLWVILTVLPFALLGLGIAERDNTPARAVLVLLGVMTLAVRAMSRVGDACLRSGGMVRAWTPLGTAEAALASMRAAAVLGGAVGADGFWVAALTKESRFPKVRILLDRGGCLSKRLIDRGIPVLGRSRVLPYRGEEDEFWNEPGERS